MEVGVGADGVDIEEIGHAEFAEADFQAAAGEFVEEGEEAALVFDFIFAKREDFVDDAAGEVGGFT